MRKMPFVYSNEISIKNIRGYFERMVNKFGTGAKIDIPKEHLGKKVVVLVYDD